MYFRDVACVAVVNAQVATAAPSGINADLPIGASILGARAHR